MTSRATTVFINGRFLTQPITGVQRTAHELVRAIDQLVDAGEARNTPYQFTILTPRHTPTDLPLRRLRVVQVGWLRGHAWEQIELPLYARHGVLVNFANTGPLLVRRQLVIIHDASVFAVPGAYARFFRLWYQFLIPRVGKRARVILTDSCFSSQELARRAGIPEAKVRIVPLGSEHILNTAAEAGVFARVGIGQRPFILAVGSRSPHKNFDVVLRALKLLEEASYDIVLVGGTNTRIFEDVSELVSSRMKQTGYVTDGELRALYERAACFVFPSVYEGFGLPPLEAMACGCPVIVSHAASLPEVCGRAALYFNPQDPADLARRIAEVMESASLRAELSRCGVEHASDFTWRASARAVLHAIKDLEA